MSIDTLDGTSWDVLIAGTGLHESLLALALSRSGKSILHVDKNDYYGGPSAALSLQDAEDWAVKHAGEPSGVSFANAFVQKPSLHSPGVKEQPSLQLSFSRAYSLALSPQLIYAQSTILPTFVTSKVEGQLDFLAVGSCFVFSREPVTGSTDSGVESARGTLIRVPSSREDVFADQSLQPRHKRGLMKFIRFISEFEQQGEVWQPHEAQPFEEFLSTQFNIPAIVQRPIHALALSPSVPEKTRTSFALPRIARHLRSIGVFGPGFGSVIPKWGGLSEIAQVGCRASAVGGGVYVLGNGLKGLDSSSDKGNNTSDTGSDANLLRVSLKRGEIVTSRWVVMASDNAPTPQSTLSASEGEGDPFPDRVHRSIYIISSALKDLFPQLVDGAPTPAAAVIICPSTALFSDNGVSEPAPIYIMVHSSDTGECPAGQSVLYASVSADAGPDASILDRAVSAFLESIEEEPTPQILWQLHYEQRSSVNSDPSEVFRPEVNDWTLVFPPPPQDIAFDDKVLREVRDAWQKIVGPDGGDFMMFDVREGLGDEEDDG